MKDISIALPSACSMIPVHHLKNDSLYEFDNQENREIKADLMSCTSLRSVDDMHYEMLNTINEI